MGKLDIDMCIEHDLIRSLRNEKGLCCFSKLRVMILS